MAEAERLGVPPLSCSTDTARAAAGPFKQVEWRV